MQAPAPRFLRLALFLAVSTLALTPSSSSAGPWTRGAGEFYAKVGESLYQADAFRNADGQTVEGVSYLNATTFLYGELGLLEGLHAQAYVPFSVARNAFDDASVFNTGVGDAILGLQASPLKLPIPLALRLDAKLPLYRGQITGPDAARTPARGDAQVDLAGWLSAGASFAKVPVYFFGELGYQHRTGWGWDETAPADFVDSAAFNGQVGYWVLDGLLMAWNASGVIALADDTVTKSYVITGPSLFWPVSDRVALEADAYWTPYSRNSAAGWSMGLGLSFRSN